MRDIDALDDASVVAPTFNCPTLSPVTRYIALIPNTPPLPAVEVAAWMPYPSVPAVSPALAEVIVYAGEDVARPPFASLMLRVHPRPVLHEIVVVALGVAVETEPLVSVPNAVDALAVLQVTLDATVALTVTVLEKAGVNE
jgi:hypothetical protein